MRGLYPRIKLIVGDAYHFGLAITDDIGSNRRVAASPVALTLMSDAATVLPVMGGVESPRAVVCMVAAGLIALAGGLLLRRKGR